MKGKISNCCKDEVLEEYDEFLCGSCNRICTFRTNCKFDKYGCIDENCKEHYPTISRATIINENEMENTKNEPKSREDRIEEAIFYLADCIESGSWVNSAHIVRNIISGE